MAYDRASDIPVTNVALFILGAGEGEGEGSGNDWAGTRGAEVSVTGLGGVGELKAGPGIESGGAGYISGVPSEVP